MYQSLHSDKVAAEAALSGWMTMLNKAGKGSHQKNGKNFTL